MGMPPERASRAGDRKQTVALLRWACRAAPAAGSSTSNPDVVCSRIGPHKPQESLRTSRLCASDRV